MFVLGAGRCTVYYVLDGHEAREATDISEWSQLFANQRVRLIAHDQIGNKYTVSTRFTGYGYRIGSDGPPMVFETTVFCDHDCSDPYWLYSESYATWGEAEIGHTQLVNQIKNRA